MYARRIVSGSVGGLAGGLVFGLMMGMMGMFPVIGKMVGVPSAAVGFVMHMGISAMIGTFFGATFGWLVHGRQSGLVFGLLYGAAWWFLEPLTLMPFMMGMGLGANLNLSAATSLLPSLMGHLIYGGILGLSYNWLIRRSLSRSPASELEVRAVRMARH